MDEETPEAECGHVVVVVDGEEQHHRIPDDGAPHAPTGECECGPAVYRVYEHVDQDSEPADLN